MHFSDNKDSISIWVSEVFIKTSVHAFRDPSQFSLWGSSMREKIMDESET